MSSGALGHLQISAKYLRKSCGTVAGCLAKEAKVSSEVKVQVMQS